MPLAYEFTPSGCGWCGPVRRGSYGRGLLLVRPDGYVGRGGGPAAGPTGCLGRFGTVQNASLGT